MGIKNHSSTTSKLTLVLSSIVLKLEDTFWKLFITHSIPTTTNEFTLHSTCFLPDSTPSIYIPCPRKRALDIHGGVFLGGGFKFRTTGGKNSVLQALKRRLEQFDDRLASHIGLFSTSLRVALNLDENVTAMGFSPRGYYLK